MTWTRSNKIRTVTALVVGILLPVIVWAQWTTSSNDIYSSNSGNVGIGTSSPAQKLDITGNMLLAGDIAQNRLGVGSSGTQDIGIQLMNYGRKHAGIRFSGNQLIIEDASYSGAPSTWYGGQSLDFIVRNGNVGIGTTSPSTELEVVGDVTVSGNISAKYQDLAEWVPSSYPITPGTVVVLDPDHSNSVIPSSEAYDTRVAGVVSSSPGIVLGEAGENKVKVATTGRVKVRVDARSGAIHIGDLLVTSDRDGIAMRSEPMIIGGRKIHQPGTLVGKALEPLADGQGEILVLLSLQ